MARRPTPTLPTRGEGADKARRCAFDHSNGPIMKPITPSPVETELPHCAGEGIPVLDRALGTEIQALKLGEVSDRGTRFPDLPTDLRGNNDIRIRLRPDRARE